MLMANGLAMVMTLATFGADAPKTESADFVRKACCCNMTEIEAGKMAAKKAESSDVKAYGEMMVTDHTKAQELLKEACKTCKMECPSEQTKEGKECCEKLQKATKGKDFDRTYIKMQVENHKKVIKALEQAKKSGAEGVKEYATKVLPIVRKHETAAKKIMEKLGSST